MPPPDQSTAVGNPNFTVRVAPLDEGLEGQIVADIRSIRWFDCNNVGTDIATNVIADLTQGLTLLAPSGPFCGVDLMFGTPIDVSVARQDGAQLIGMVNITDLFLEVGSQALSATDSVVLNVGESQAFDPATYGVAAGEELTFEPGDELHEVFVEGLYEASTLWLDVDGDLLGGGEGDTLLSAGLEGPVDEDEDEDEDDETDVIDTGEGCQGCQSQAPAGWLGAWLLALSLLRRRRR
jgi:uncharacterized protein (TIGR03382 family)